eukprot:9200289-Pyramimonas_sp.AAC.1
MAARGLVHEVPPEVPTHRAGRRLDVVLTRATRIHIPADTRVHNGAHCREAGCKQPFCRQLQDFLGSADLDHSPVTWACPSMPQGAGMPTISFDGTAEEWHAAVE